MIEAVQKYSVLLIAAGIFLFGIALNLNTLPAFFVGDDFDLVKAMGLIPRWTGFLTYTFWGVYEPIWWLSLGIDQRLYGLNPIGYHVQGILFHALTGLLLYLFVFHLAGNKWAAVFPAVLFLTHPLHDEAIAYISGRPHAIAAFFTLATLLFYHLFRERKAWLYLALSFITFILSIAAKEISLTLPGLLLLYEVFYRFEWKERGKSLTGISWIVPYFVLLGAYLLARSRFVSVAQDKLQEGEGAAFGPLSLGFLRNIGRRLPDYLSMMFWPFPYSRFAKYQLEEYGFLGFLLAMAVILAGLILIWKWRKEGRVPRTLLFALAAMFVMLLPVFHEDLGFRRRYTYFASTAFAAFAGLLVWRLYAAQLRAKRLIRTMVLALFVALNLVFVVMLLQNNQTYRRSGDIAWNVIKDISSNVNPNDREVTLCLFGLPRFTGGEDVNGAYLFHHTDFRSAMALYVKPRVHLRYVFKTSYAEKFHSEVNCLNYREGDLIARFEDEKAFKLSYFEKAGEEDENDFMKMTVLDVDPASRTVRALVRLKDRFFSARPTYFFRYDGGHYVPVAWKKKGEL
jgi:hypothetical protein